MHAPYHEALTRGALGRNFSPEALDQVVQANLGQDSLLNLLRSELHFDANAFEKAHVYAQKQADQVPVLAARMEIGPARAAFGRLTHGLQDFYAHTNYAALWQELHPGEETQIDPVDPAILESGRLIAARVYYPLEALTIFPALTPAIARRLPADSHANMNLDSPDRGPLFRVAMAAARKRTEIAFHTAATAIREAAGEERVGAFTGAGGK